MLQYFSRVVLIAGALLIAGMVLFPPWRYTILVPRKDNIDVPGGYAFISSPPEPTQERCPACWYEATHPDELDKLLSTIPPDTPTSTTRLVAPRQYQTSIRMDNERLAVQIVAASLICGLLTLAVRKRA